MMLRELQHISKMFRTNKILVSLLFATALTLCTGNRQNKGKQNVMLERAVKTAMGFHERKIPSGTPPDPKETVEGTRYMMELYDTYRNGLSPKSLKTNTVRSIQATIGKVDGVEVFLFNLSTISATDQVIRADMHFYKRKMKIMNENQDFHMILHEVAPSYMTLLNKLDLRTPRYGWQAYDVTDGIRSCLATSRAQPHLFAARFVRVKESKRGQWDEVDIPVKKFMFQHSKPFLIVYSNDTQHISLDHLDTYFQANALENSVPLKSVKSKDKKHEREMEQTEQDERNLDDTNPEHVLFKRSIHDNELPQDPEDDLYTYQKISYNIPRTHPSMLQGRQKPTPEPVDNTDYIPYPKRYRKRRKGRKNRRKNRKKDRGGNRARDYKEELPPPDQWQQWVDAQNLSDDSKKADMTLCGKKRLVVDFADIGWSEWIIAPKSFEAHYCSGKCSFPLEKVQSPSNHATIQSIVHAVGLNAGVPEPCCVPDMMSSVTLLYFDENKNVVLKNYPGMTVESCACR